MNRIVVMVLGVLLISQISKADDWSDNVKVKGDLRYRYEMIKAGSSDARNRNRLRARVAVDAKVNDITKAYVQFATGSNDPVSTNQTLGDGFSTKSIMLDMAYFNIKPEQVAGLSITAGKFKNPFYKPGSSELLWDSDLNPEGGTAHYTKETNNYEIELIAAGLWITERSTAKDSWMASGEGVFRYSLNDSKSNFVVGGGYYSYINGKGFAPFFDSTDPMGNSVDGSGNYVNDFKLMEAFVELNHEFDKMPVTVFGDFVNNTAADSLNTGWLFGVKAGKTKDTGSWAVRYNYRKLEKDAVIGIFTDSDFRGGGTDAKGHELGGSYQVMKNGTFNVSYFINKIGLNNNETDFDRLQVDLQLKF